ncbi:MAG TPA: ester cyclase [Chloroflexota bacterium]|jgi:steroid delta-isomerase-like uncharacterized protein
MAEDTKAVVRRYMDELWNNRNPAAADEILADDLVWIHPTLGNGQGRQAAMDFIKEMREAYPDLEGRIRSLVAEGDQVTAHWEATGSHRGPYRGAAPTGQRLTWEGVSLYRVVNGRIVEHRAFPDTTAQGSPHHIAQRG